MKLMSKYIYVCLCRLCGTGFPFMRIALWDFSMTFLFLSLPLEKDLQNYALHMPTSKTYPFELIKNPSFPLYVIKSSNICLVPRHRKREGAASLAKLPSCVSPRRNELCLYSCIVMFFANNFIMPINIIILNNYIFNSFW